MPEEEEELTTGWDDMASRKWVLPTRVGSALGEGPLQTLSMGMEATAGGMGDAPSRQEFYAALVS